MRPHAIFLTLALAALPSLAYAQPAYTYFGEDRATLGDTVRIAHPNSDAARTSFLGSLLPTGAQGFESFAGGTPAPLTISYGTYSATLTGTGQIFDLPGTGTNGGRFPIDGNKYWGMPVSAGVSATMTFSQPISAFGVYMTDLGDEGANLLLKFTHADATTSTVNLTSLLAGGAAPTASVLFFGYIHENPFTSVSFDLTAGNGQLGLDILDVAPASLVTIPNFPGGAGNGSAPEPGTLALLLGGLGVGSAWRQRRR